EMRRRIILHRERRAARSVPWQTIEEPIQIAGVIARQPGGCVLLECLPLWLPNLMAGIPGHAPLDDRDIGQELVQLREAIGRALGRVIVVSAEVGCGIVPANALARRFAD